MSADRDDGYDDDPRAAFDDRPSRRPRILIITALSVVIAFIALTTFASLFTDHLWYSSGGYGKVFDVLFWTRIGLFVGFGLVMALAVGGNILAAYRLRPFLRAQAPDPAGLDRYRDTVTPIRTWLLLSVSGLLGVFGGASAAGEWRTFLLWRHGVSFNTQDPWFHRDVGYYVFDLPWLHFLVSYVIAVVLLSLVAAALVHYLFGGIRLQVTHDRISSAAQAQLSVLLGIFVLAKAADYWLDRYDVVTANGRLISGMTYTDDHAVIPAKNILVGIAIICALLFFLNLWRRTWLLPSVGLALLVLSSILIGLIWPGIVQQFQVDPTEADKEAPYIQRNIEATRAAYDLNDIDVRTYTNATTAATVADLVAETSTTPVVDPQLVQRAFEQRQQGRAYYTVAPVLDVDHYDIQGADRALVLGVRELDQSGISESDRNWTNLHTVYTHSNGVIAAFGNQRPADDSSEASDIQWAQGQDPGQDALERSTGAFEDRIYFGEKSPDYSIVGKEPGQPDVELDLGKDGEGRTITYDGGGGVSVGSLFRQVLYAVKFGDPNFLLSGRINSDSRVLYYRQPSERVEKVAPWLTVDSDVYPAIVDGRIQWIVDGYTTTDRYPGSQRESFATMTDDSLNRPSGVQTLPTDQINYMRNAVKATVDAYTGQVTLYEWDTTDPILKAWEAAFPGTVRPKDSIPADLLPHLRYPEDYFKVQRYQFARYHVTNPNDFYRGNDRWAVPEDPITHDQLQPPYRMFTRDAETGQQVWSLTSNYVPNNKANLIGFVAVDSDPTSADYGRIRVLEPPDENTPGPGLVVANLISDPHITKKVQSFRLGDAVPKYGNLLTVPLSAGLMYVEPVYSTRTSTDSASYATLRYVMVSYGSKVGIGKTLPAALADMIGGKVPTTGGDPGPSKGGGKVSAQVLRLLRASDRDLAAARKAFEEGRGVAYVRLQAKAQRELGQALKLLK